MQSDFSFIRKILLCSERTNAQKKARNEMKNFEWIDWRIH